MLTREQKAELAPILDNRVSSKVSYAIIESIIRRYVRKNMQIVNLSPEAIIRLSEAASRADAEGRRFRVAIDGDGFKYKVGEGAWSPPFYDQPDPYRS